MTLRHWVNTFQMLHEMAAQGQLDDHEQALYADARRQLTHALQASRGSAEKKWAQGISAARVLPVDLELAGRNVRTLTLEVSTNGFSALVAERVALGSEVPFVLHLRRERLIHGTAIAEIDPVSGREHSSRMNFTLRELGAAAAHELEIAVIQFILEGLMQVVDRGRADQD